MARLSTLKPRIASPTQAVARTEPISRDQERYRRSPWRGWYNLKRWKVMRWDALVSAGFTCEMCGRLEGDTSKLVADHRKPHRGDADLFWDRENLWCLCEGCHSSEKQKEEAATPPGVWW